MNKPSCLRFVLAALLLVVGPRLVQAEWRPISTSGFVVDAGSPALALSKSFNLVVSTDEAGDAQWIVQTVAVDEGDVIDAVAVCYSAPNLGTFISRLRLSEFGGLGDAFIRHDDDTDLTSATDDCHVSLVGDYSPAGAVELALRLHFANATHSIKIAAVSVHLK
jgi:hypothetical protein